ncbi:MAG: hypothetical protein IJI37_05020, partial [Opitutales bacterium]|nr:hypothetical protein [Opitutales bacterium]
DERVDLDDFVVSEFKKNGVYIYNAVFAIPLKENSFHLRDDIKLRALFGYPGARETWRDAAVETLNHVNPYTGLAFKDDPVYACLEIYNELAICYSRFDDNANRDPRDKIRPETKEFIYGKWAKWLEKRYGGDISKLNDAWNARMRARKKFAFASFKEVPIIVNGNPDWERCCWDFNEEFTRYAKKVLRDGGYKGLIVQNNLGASIYGSGVRSRTSDFVAFNTYFCHPSSFDLQNAKVRQTSSIGDLGAYWKYVATTKIEGRPFGISEYNHCFWNKYRHEMAALFAPYSAFQNFSFLTLHEGAVPLPTAQGKFISFFNIYNSPACRASELLSSAAFIRGDVKKSRKTVRMNVSEKFLRDNPEAVRGFNLKQASVALLSGFVSTYEGEVPEPASGVKPRKPDLEMSPQGSTEFLAEAWFHSAIDNNNKTFDLEKFAEKMRQKGILPKGNKTDIAAGVYQTDTGQITLNQNDMTLTVQTPRTEIIALSKRLDGAAKIIAGARSSVCATVALTSMDGKRLANSSRMTLIYLTREGNMGMNLSYDDVSVAGQSGGVPVLQNGILELNLRLDPKKSYELYALALNGERREKLPTTLQDGLLSVKIDNSRLTHGSTPFYELVVK